jgi:hypothetical protein
MENKTEKKRPKDKPPHKVRKDSAKYDTKKRQSGIIEKSEVSLMRAIPSQNECNETKYE